MIYNVCVCVRAQRARVHIDKSSIRLCYYSIVLFRNRGGGNRAIVVGDDMKQTCVGLQCHFQRNVKNRFLPVRTMCVCVSVTEYVCVVKTIDNMYMPCEGIRR